MRFTHIDVTFDVIGHQNRQNVHRKYYCPILVMLKEHFEAF